MADKRYVNATWKRIEQGLSAFEQDREAKYRRWLKLYSTDTGASKPGVNAEGSTPSLNMSMGDLSEMRRSYYARLNLATSFINIKTSALTVRDPTFAVDIHDEKFHSPQMILTLQHAMRRLWRQSRAQEAMRLADTYRRIFGFSLIKTSWEDVWSANGELLDSRSATEAIPPTRILFDPQAESPSLERSRWICEVVWIDRGTLEDMGKGDNPWKNIKDVQQYDRVKRISMLRDTNPLASADGAFNDFNPDSEGEDHDDEMVPIFLMWDKVMRKYLVLGYGAKKDPDRQAIVLYEEDDPFPYVDFYPHVMMKGHISPESFHPIGDMEMMEPHLDLLARLYTIFISYSVRSLPKVGYTEGSLTEQGRRAMVEPTIGAGVEVRKSGPPPNQALVQLGNNTPPTAIIEAIQRVEQYLNEVTSITDYHRGVLPGGRHTMGEVGQLVALSGVRGTMELKELEEVMSDVAMKLYELNRHTGQTISVLMDQGDGQQRPIELKMADLPPAIEMSVNSGSTAFTDRMQDRNDLTALFQMLLEVPQVSPQAMPILKHIIGTYQQLNTSDATEILNAYQQQAKAQEQAEQQQSQQDQQQQQTEAAMMEEEQNRAGFEGHLSDMERIQAMAPGEAE